MGEDIHDCLEELFSYFGWLSSLLSWDGNNTFFHPPYTPKNIYTHTRVCFCKIRKKVNFFLNPFFLINCCSVSCKIPHSNWKSSSGVSVMTARTELYTKLVRYLTNRCILYTHASEVPQDIEERFRLFSISVASAVTQVTWIGLKHFLSFVLNSYQK